MDSMEIEKRIAADDRRASVIAYLLSSPSVLSRPTLREAGVALGHDRPWAGHPRLEKPTAREAIRSLSAKPVSLS